MQAANALQVFRDFLAATGLSLDTITPQQATDSMIQFFEQVRADECEVGSGNDMVLFQWGVYNWGTGDSFEYNITRQLIYPELVPPDHILPDDEEYEDIFGQLSLTLKFEPIAELRAIEAGDLWCKDLDGVPAFKAYIETCEATREVQGRLVAARELDFGNAE